MKTSNRIKQAVAKHNDHKPTPDEVNVSAVFLALANNCQPSDVVDVTLNDEAVPVRFQVLTGKDVEWADVETVRHFRALKVEPTIEAFNTRKAACILEMACREPELTELSNGKKFYRRVFQSSDQVLESFSDDQFAMLFEQYLIVKVRYAVPGDDSAAIQTQEDMEVWIDTLSREANASFLARLPQHIVALNLHAMALHIKALQRSPQSLWASIGELRAMSSDSGTTSSIEPASEPASEPDTRLTMSARKQ